MRQIIAFIICDTCHDRFGFDDHIFGSDPANCPSIVQMLEWAAEHSGWICFRGRHQCHQCILLSMHPEEFVPH